jgi:serine/threonine protein kinase
MNSAWWKQFENQTIEHTYVLHGLVGIGAFGGVFRADHRIEDVFVREVAVKLISCEPEHIQRQLREFILATTLRHPHLLECFHAGSTILQHAKLLYLVMELGEYSLESRMKPGLLTPFETHSLVKELASALDHLHRNKRVHRDVKPANVLRTGGTWKLSDFGTIRQSGTLTTSHTNVVTGTMMYMPPESFEGVVSPAWDIWSLGVLLLQVLTGEDPYPQTSQHQLMWAISQKDPKIPANLPRPFDEIINGCLVRDHHARWSADQILDALADSGSTKASNRQQRSEQATVQVEREAIGPEPPLSPEQVIADAQAEVTKLKRETQFEAAENVIDKALELYPSHEQLLQLQTELTREREAYTRSQKIAAVLVVVSTAA